MTPEQFCYWLQGKLEDRNVDTIPYAEWQTIKNHLATVFEKHTPESIIFKTKDSDIYDSGFNKFINKPPSQMIC